MSLDLSVIVWTILTFGVLMLVLNRFLFRPVRAFMQQRQERIDRGLAAAQAAGDKRRKLEEQLQEERQQAFQARRRAAEEETLRRKKETLRKLEQARSEAESRRAAAETALGRRAGENRPGSVGGHAPADGNPVRPPAGGLEEMKGQ